jgi:DNA-binding PadR family transcriptional regulator
MTKSDYQRAYDSAEQELTELLQVQELIEKRIIVLRQNLSSLAALCKQDDVDFEPGILAGALIDRMGITADILAIVNREPSGLSPAEVRNQLKELGYDLSKYQNPLATVHVILDRLEKADKIVSTNVDRRKYFSRKTATPGLSVEALARIRERANEIFTAPKNRNLTPEEKAKRLLDIRSKK